MPMRRHHDTVALGTSARRQRRMMPDSAVFRRRWVLPLFRTLLGLLIIASIVLALSVRLSPAVGDAPARVVALDASHHSPTINVPSTDRIAMATVAAEDERFYSHHGIDTPRAPPGSLGTRHRGRPRRKHNRSTTGQGAVRRWWHRAAQRTPRRGDCPQVRGPLLTQPTADRIASTPLVLRSPPV